jgi:mono/diheme cytochrome c family protein
MAIAGLMKVVWRTALRRPLAAAAAVVAFGVAAVVATAPRKAFEPDEAGLFEGGDAAKGRLVFAAGDCSSCHATPGQPDRLLLGGGMSLASPFGALRPPNISPDPDFGIGRWRGLDLANAIMSGVSPGGAHYYPALPYAAYARMSVADVRDLMAYIRTLPPARSEAPPHELSFPFTVRRFIGFWKLVYVDRSPLEYRPDQDAAWNRGRYLVEAVGHCAECHSSRDLFGGVKPETRFAGGQNPEGVGFAPNITPARLGAWSEAELASFLEHGRSPSGRAVGATMRDVVTNFAMLPPEDRRAIAAYLKSLPARPTPSP